MVTCVSCPNPSAGTNFSSLVPAPCQVPAILGLIVGSGEEVASGSENLISMVLAPLTPAAFLRGLTDVRLIGATDDVLLLAPGFAAELLSAVFWADACVMAIQTPAARSKTMAPPTAVIRVRRCVKEVKRSPSSSSAGPADPDVVLPDGLMHTGTSSLRA